MVRKIAAHHAVQPSALIGNRQAGLAVIGTAAVLFFGARYLEGRVLFGGVYELFAEFERADGLRVGSPVTTSGIRIDTVRAVALAPDARGVRVRMEVEHDVVLREGATASLDGMAAFDNVKVSLHPGKSGDIPIAEGTTLPGAAPGYFDDLEQNAEQLARRVDGALFSVAGTFNQATGLVERTGVQAQPMLDDLGKASAATDALLAKQAPRIDALLLGMTGVSDNLSALTLALKEVVDRPPESGDGRSLDATLHNLEEMTASLSRSSHEFESMLGRKNNDKGTLRLLTADSTLYFGVDSVALRLNSILADFERDPGK